MREGQMLPLNVRAFKPPKDDMITLRLSGDANGDGLLDALEAVSSKINSRRYPGTKSSFGV